jgi:flagellar biosynthetic protein FlhB
MSDQEERTQDPTPHKRQQAREDGQIARSVDLVSALILVVGLVALLWMGQSSVAFFGRYAHQQLSGPAWVATNVNDLQAAWWGTLGPLSSAVMPLLGLIMLTAVLSNLMQFGWMFLPEKAMPNLERLDVLSAAQQMFSASNAIRLGFGLLKIGLVATIAGLCFYDQLDELLGLIGLEVPQLALFMSESLVWMALKIALALLVLAIIDYGYQRWKYERDLRMTPQEVKEEMRNQTGDPQIIARRRAVQRQLVLNRLKSAVPKATVVVTNPTELAIAIQYEPESMAAPVVVAKGAGVLAQRIRQLALEHGIPIIERKPLAQALYRQVDLNRPVPSDLYAAVAEVLAFVYQLTGKKMPGQSAKR